MFKKLLLIGLVSAFMSSSYAKDLKITATVFALYDFAKEVTAGNDEVKLTYLMKNGADPHSYQGTAKDMITILDSDLNLYIGGPSDAFVENALKKQHSDSISINFMEILGPQLLEEEIKEGMTHDHSHHGHEHHDHDHAHVHVHDHDHAHMHEEDIIKGTVLNKNLVDEHLWLSLKNAIIMVHKIKEALITLDAEHKDLYEKNANAYVAKLTKLDQEFEEKLATKKHKSIIFADRFPFIYLMHDYDIEYFAAFPGCAAESNASFNTIAFLSSKTLELDADHVLTMERSDGKIADAIKHNSGQDFNVDELNSMQAVLDDEIKAGANYLNIMQHNLQVLDRVIK